MTKYHVLEDAWQLAASTLCRGGRRLDKNTGDKCDGVSELQLYDGGWRMEESNLARLGQRTRETQI